MMSLNNEWAVLPLRSKIIVSTVLFVGVLALIQIAGGATGKLCVAGVIGGSCSDVAPHGSRVLVLPLKAREGDLVYAWVPGDLDSPDQADHQPGRVVKRLRSGRLVSTASAEHYDSGYRILGRVVVVLHTERWFPWLNKGSQTSAPGYKPPTADDLTVVDNTSKIADARLKWLGENCKPLSIESATILGGHIKDGKVIADEAEMTVVVDLGHTAHIEEVEIQPPGEFWGFTVEPALGTCRAGKFHPQNISAREVIVHVTGSLSGPPDQPAQIDKLVVWVAK